jgi:transposase
MALKGKIRALYQREGKSISEIARRTSLSRNTIKKWLKAPAEAAPKYRRASLARQAGAVCGHADAGLEGRRAPAAA